MEGNQLRSEGEGELGAYEGRAFTRPFANIRQ